MLYYILRPLTRIALKAYFRSITINGLEHMPKDDPVIICSNHPTGFIEPCLLACFLPRTLHFLVRGDLFERPLLKKILIATNQIPIYRFRDGYEKLRDNKSVMSMTYEKLSKGGAVLIFPEASTKQVKYLRPLKKGAARMSLETMELYPELNLKIIPIGINYSAPNRWRSYVNINIGEPITPVLPSDDYDVRKAVTDLTRKIQQELSSLLLVLNKGVEEKTLDKALALGQWEKKVGSSIRVTQDSPEKFAQERLISKSLNVDNQQIIEEAPVIDKPIRKRLNVLDFLMATVIFFPVMLLLSMNAIPVLFGIYMRKKYVREPEFLASVSIAASLGLYMILFPVVLVILIYYYHWYGLLVFFLPMLGLLALLGRDYLVSIWETFKLHREMGEQKVTLLIKQGVDAIGKIRNSK
ncbi:lysophospholipid acyltransferase family protein [Portibacter marinus]|uniref:lysophospholipid acyltransferase family protein n=1 Tax=Portibacter marinus TaxID=2898660 RepID=UPI001F444BC3|nr:lysophospholipid acyltransferase family protein [Portibacter marinus]